MGLPQACRAARRVCASSGALVGVKKSGVAHFQRNHTIGRCWGQRWQGGQQMAAALNQRGQVAWQRLL